MSELDHHDNLYSSGHGQSQRHAEPKKKSKWKFQLKEEKKKVCNMVLKYALQNIYFKYTNASGRRIYDWHTSKSSWNMHTVQINCFDFNDFNLLQE